MSVLKIGPENFETITIQASPKVFFKSGSAGITGSAPLFSRKSDSIKETSPLAVLSKSFFSEGTLRQEFQAYREDAAAAVADGGSKDFSSAAENFLNKIADASKAPSQDIESKIIRFEPSFTYTTDTTAKTMITNVLMPTYLTRYPTSQFAYTNYHSLNFFTSSKTPANAVLLYPNSASVAHSTSISGSYVVHDAFTFEFFVKPKCLFSRAEEYKPGTVLHLSSTYAVSIVSGSSKDGNGVADAFRLQLQLSHSADVAPRVAAPGNYPNDLIFLSEDNTLQKDSWHHVAIRWSANADGRKGAFYVDNEEKGTFTIPSASIAPDALPNNPAALAVGNYYEGSNSGDNRQVQFFTSQSAGREGLVVMNASSVADNPTKFEFTHPLVAEVHELRIFDIFRPGKKIKEGSEKGISLDEQGLKFYLPPFFTTKSPTRKQLAEFGGVLQTPFLGVSGSTKDPFNISLSFGVGGHYLNLENFTQDFASKNFPRAMELTGAQVTVTTIERSCNEFLYRTGSVRYRNLIMMPCDNGNFMPNFGLVRDIETAGTASVPTRIVKSGSAFYRYRNDLDEIDFSLINLRDLLPSASFKNFFTKYVPVDENGQEQQRYVDGLKAGDFALQVGAGFESQIMGASPESMGIDPGEVLTIFQRTRDDSSNEVVFFDVSNLFYGNRIKPGTLKITDTNATGSGGDIQITLRDDGYGNLYRSNTVSKPATWNSVEIVFYDEGIVMIKSPNIPLFGKDDVEVEFRGENEVHVSKLDVVAPAGMINSSSAPSFKVMSSSNSANNQDSRFVAITGINFHDDNLNVIMRSKFAQPVIKRSSDKILFRTKIDF